MARLHRGNQWTERRDTLMTKPLHFTSYTETLKLYNGARGEATFRTPASVSEMIAHCSVSNDRAQVRLIRLSAPTLKLEHLPVYVPVRPPIKPATCMIGELLCSKV